MADLFRTGRFRPFILVAQEKIRGRNKTDDGVPLYDEITQDRDVGDLSVFYL